MGIIEQLLGDLAAHYFEHVFTPAGMLVGMLLAIALWFLESAIMELRRRPFSALILLAAAGTIFFGVFVRGGLSRLDCLRCLGAGIFFYGSYRAVFIISARRKNRAIALNHGKSS